MSFQFKNNTIIVIENLYIYNVCLYSYYSFMLCDISNYCVMLSLVTKRSQHESPLFIHNYTKYLMLSSTLVKCVIFSLYIMFDFFWNVYLVLIFCIKFKYLPFVDTLSLSVYYLFIFYIITIILWHTQYKIRMY